jgi:cytochrome b pre-mRNA-processing protein 3
MSLMSRLKSAVRPVPPGDALYRRIVELARKPDAFLAGAVPDTVDGRFDMVALVLALVLLRLETAGEAQLPAALTERFIADMDGSLREMGIGDQTVGKHIGRMVSALGGRLGAYRDAFAPDAPADALTDALARNLYRGADVEPEALAWQERHVRDLAARIAAMPLARLMAGEIDA